MLHIKLLFKQKFIAQLMYYFLLPLSVSVSASTWITFMIVSSMLKYIFSVNENESNGDLLRYFWKTLCEVIKFVAGKSGYTG